MTECPGLCNRRWRDAEADGREHDVEAVAGEPVWCGDCAHAIAARLDDLAEIVALLEDGIDAQRGGGGDAPVSGSRGRPSPSAAVDDVDEITRRLEYWEDAGREYLDQTWRPARPTARRVRASVGWLATHFDQVLAAPFAEELGRDITRLHRAGRRRTATDPARVRKPAPCPGCDLLALTHSDGDKYIGCDGCGRLLSFDEYDAWTRLLAAGQPRRTA